VPAHRPRSTSTSTPRADAFIFGRDTRTLVGSSRLREDVAGTSFLISPTAFLPDERVRGRTSRRPGAGGRSRGADVLDLYAGAGLFALPLAQRGHSVIAVEESRPAIADGEASARLNRISRTVPVRRAIGGIGARHDSARRTSSSSIRRGRDAPRA
jgi:tRNA/tmRNA/rRNA uracil-C5-methylase (TrmA/RlmC/RlmD family)